MALCHAAKDRRGPAETTRVVEWATPGSAIAQQVMCVKKDGELVVTSARVGTHDARAFLGTSANTATFSTGRIRETLSLAADTTADGKKRAYGYLTKEG